MGKTTNANETNDAAAVDAAAAEAEAKALQLKAEQDAAAAAEAMEAEIERRVMERVPAAAAELVAAHEQARADAEAAAAAEADAKAAAETLRAEQAEFDCTAELVLLVPADENERVSAIPAGAMLLFGNDGGFALPGAAIPTDPADWRMGSRIELTGTLDFMGGEAMPAAATVDTVALAESIDGPVLAVAPLGGPAVFGRGLALRFGPGAIVFDNR